MSMKKSAELWLINELSKSENPLEIIAKYNRVFSETLDNQELKKIAEANASDIKELKELIKCEVTGHKYADPYNRMEALTEIKDACMDGTPIFNKDGTVIGTKTEYASAIQAIKAMREEATAESKYQLDLLKVMLLGGEQNKSFGTEYQSTSVVVGEAQDREISGNIEGPPSDNDEFFN